MSETAVDLRDVFCLHRTREGDSAALQGTTLAVAPGELVCVLGPSGAGKSTLLRVIAGIQQPSAGVAQVLGQDIGRLPARRRARIRHERIGFLGQRADAALAPDLTVEHAIRLPLALRGAPVSAQRARASELLESVGLSDRADALPGELSGGERQRIALCAALAHRPLLLLADEPTGELDDASARAVRALIADLARAHRASAVIVSHDPDAASIADRTVRMRDGRVVEDLRDGLVVARGGWVQLPSELVVSAGIKDRAHARAAHGGVLVTSAPSGEEEQTAQGRSERRPSWSPAHVEIQAVTRGYARRQVLDRFGAALDAGRLTVVSGRSGAGKSTLLRLLCGLERPDAGEVSIDGVSLSEQDPEQLAALRRARIGYLPQEPWPVGFLSAEENVALALRIRGWEADEAGERATVVLTRVGLADRARQPVARLSAGEGQRVALARALASARGLLIVDEPTSRLDEASAVAVADLLAAAAREDNQTVMCATHDPEVIRRADVAVEIPGPAGP